MATRHDVLLTWDDGREETVPASEDETVLEAAESAGLCLPFGCRTGACGSCVGHLVDGRVSHVGPPLALNPGHVEAGYVLCCLGRPTTACRIAVGTAVQEELVSNPWE